MKKKASVRIIAVALKSRADAERIVRETLSLQLDRENAIVTRDKAIQEIAGAHNSGIDALSAKIETNMAMLEQWATANPQEFPAPAKSIRVDGHQLGWRLGNFAASTLKGWTWKKVADALQNAPKKIAERFIRVKIEPNKDALIEARGEADLLAEFGVEIVQGETFYLDPNREGQPDTALQNDRREVAAA